MVDDLKKHIESFGYKYDEVQAVLKKAFKGTFGTFGQGDFGIIFDVKTINDFLKTIEKPPLPSYQSQEFTGWDDNEGYPLSAEEIVISNKRAEIENKKYTFSIVLRLEGGHTGALDEDYDEFSRQSPENRGHPYNQMLFKALKEHGMTPETAYVIRNTQVVQTGCEKAALLPTTNPIAIKNLVQLLDLQPKPALPEQPSPEKPKWEEKTPPRKLKDEDGWDIRK